MAALVDRAVLPKEGLNKSIQDFQTRIESGTCPDSMTRVKH